MSSRKYTLNKEDGLKILEVIGWTTASAIIAIIIEIIAQVDFGSYVWVVPMVNTILYALKQFIDEKQDSNI